MSVHGLQYWFQTQLKGDHNAAVIWVRCDMLNLLGANNDAFGEKKSGSQRGIIAWGSHGNGKVACRVFDAGFRLGNDANFYGFFNGYKIIYSDAVSVFEAGDFAGRYTEFVRHLLQRLPI